MCPLLWLGVSENGGNLRLRHSLGPVRLQQRRVVDNGWEQGREGPEEERWEELADNRVLEDKVHSRERELEGLWATGAEAQT